MFEYTICNQADEEIFKKQCAALEKHIPNIEQKVSLVDVDGSEIRTYLADGSKIEVHNDNYINELYIKSEIELEQFFK